MLRAADLATQTLLARLTVNRSEFPSNRSLLLSCPEKCGTIGTPISKGVVTTATNSQRFTQVAQENLAFIGRLLRRMGVAELDVDDAVQEVFLTLNQKFDVVEVGRERPYLTGIAMRVAAHYRRGGMRRARTRVAISQEKTESTASPEDLAQLRQARALLDQVLDRMPNSIRSVFVLYELEELPVPQIAELMDISQGTVASRLRRGRELFQKSARALRVRRLLEVS